MLMQYNVGILLFNEVEVLDFTGPFEVFSVTSYPYSKDKPFHVKVVAEEKKPITARGGLKVLPDEDIYHVPHFDVLIIPGGYGAEEIEIHNPVIINWLKECRKKTKIMASVCTGAFLLAQAGLLDRKKATTHWMDIDRLESRYCSIHVQRNVKFVDEGTVLTSAGISAGIDMCLYIVAKLLGDEIAIDTAKRMEYDFHIKNK